MNTEHVDRTPADTPMPDGMFGEAFQMFLNRRGDAATHTQDWEWFLRDKDAVELAVARTDSLADAGTVHTSDLVVLLEAAERVRSRTTGSSKRRMLRNAIVNALDQELIEESMITAALEKMETLSAGELRWVKILHHETEDEIRRRVEPLDYLGPTMGYWQRLKARGLTDVGSNYRPSYIGSVVARLISEPAGNVMEQE